VTGGGWDWVLCLSPPDLISLSLAPLHTQQRQQRQQRTETARTPNTIPIILPMLNWEPGDEEKEVYLSGWLNSQEKESTSRQKASLISALEAFFGSMLDRRLLESVALGEADSVALSALLSRLVSVTLLFSSTFSRVLFTASSMTGEALVS